MTKEEMIKELDETIGKANVRLLEVVGEAGSITDVVISAVYGEKAMVNSGDKTLGEFTLDMPGLKASKRAIWSVVDACKGKSEKPRHVERLSSMDDFKKRVDEMVRVANAKLAEVVKDGFPYTMEEVKIEATIEDLVVYVHSGNTPVCAEIARWGAFEAFERTRNAVWQVLMDTRAAVERRKGLRKEAEELAAEEAKMAAAIEALKSANVNPDVLGLVNSDMAKAVVSEVRKAVHEANRGLYLNYGEAATVLGGKVSDARMIVRGFLGGIVVSAGGKPCLVTRFPKSWNIGTLNKMTDFLKSDIAALGESRKKYMAKIQARFEREEKIRAAAATMAVAVKEAAEA